MANSFNVTMMLNVQGPNNLRPVVSALQNQLKNVKGTINFQVSPTTNRNVAALSSNLNALNVSLKVSQGAAAATGQAIQGVANNVAKASAGVSSFGQNIGLATRRFLAFQIGAVLAVSKVTDAIRDGINEALLFQKTLVNLSQVGTSARGIAEIADSITNLSKNLGVSSKGLAEVSVTLKQAGLSAGEVTSALEALAKTSLAPTFRDINKTTEGLIAMRQQFGIASKDFERTLGAINTVSAAFAVESEDLVEAIRRSGAAFKAASSDIQGSEQTFNQFISLVSAVRSTTRESASEIGTGLRTIFARLQSGRVAENLKALGIELRYTGEEAALAGKQIEGQFVGAWEAVSRLSAALKNVPTTDPRFAAIVEQVGGFRQISRVIPLIQQFGQAQKAYSIAQGGANSLTLDAGKAQGIFLVQLTKVREEFMDLIRTIGNNKTLQTFGALSLDLASSLIKLTKALEPLVPLLTLFAAVKLGGTLKSVASNIGTFAGNVGRGLQGHAAVRRASGGQVPGSGFGDKVPAMLEPGEFVINRKSASSIGYGRLANWNRTGIAKMARGGRVTASLAQIAAQMYPEVKNQRNRFKQLVADLGVGKLSGSSKLGGKDDEAIFKKLQELATSRGFDLGSVVAAPTGRAGAKVKKANVASIASRINEQGAIGDFFREISESNSGNSLDQILKRSGEVLNPKNFGGEGQMSKQQIVAARKAVQTAAEERRKLLNASVAAELTAAGQEVTPANIKAANRLEGASYKQVLAGRGRYVDLGGGSEEPDIAETVAEKLSRKRRPSLVSVEDVAPPTVAKPTTHQISGNVSGRESKRAFIKGDVVSTAKFSEGGIRRARKTSLPAPLAEPTPDPAHMAAIQRVVGLAQSGAESREKGGYIARVVSLAQAAAAQNEKTLKEIVKVEKEAVKTEKDSLKEIKKPARDASGRFIKGGGGGDTPVAPPATPGRDPFKLTNSDLGYQELFSFAEPILNKHLTGTLDPTKLSSDKPFAETAKSLLEESKKQTKVGEQRVREVRSMGNYRPSRLNDFPFFVNDEGGRVAEAARRRRTAGEVAGIRGLGSTSTGSAYRTAADRGILNGANAAAEVAAIRGLGGYAAFAQGQRDRRQQRVNDVLAQRTAGAPIVREILNMGNFKPARGGQGFTYGTRTTPGEILAAQQAKRDAAREQLVAANVAQIRGLGGFTASRVPGRQQPFAVNNVAGSIAAQAAARRAAAQAAVTASEVEALRGFGGAARRPSPSGLNPNPFFVNTEPGRVADAARRRRTAANVNEIRSMSSPDDLLQRQAERRAAFEARKRRERFSNFFTADIFPSFFGESEAGRARREKRNASSVSQFSAFGIGPKPQAAQRGNFFGRTLGRVGSGIASNGLLAAAFVPGLLEAGFGTVDAPRGSINAAKTAQGASGAITGAAIAGQAGLLAGGPIGAAIGAVAGGLIGLYTSLRDAQNRIEELNFEKAFRPFQSFLADVANGHTRLDAAGRGRLAGGLSAAEAEARRRVAVAGNGGTLLDRAGDFIPTTGIGGVARTIGADFARKNGLTALNQLPQLLGFERTFSGNFTSTTRERKTEAARQAAEERIKILTPELPALQQIGEQIAKGVKLNPQDVFVGAGTTQEDLDARRRGRIESFNRAGGESIAQTIAEVNRLPINQVYEQFDQLIVSANRLRHTQEKSAEALTLMTVQVHTFGHLTEAFGAAAASVHSLESSAEQISSLFDGNIATARVSGFAAGAGQIGGLDRAAFQRSLQFTQANTGGPVSADFRRVLTQVDTTMRDLPSLLAGTTFDFTNADAIQSSIGKLLTDNLKLDKGVAGPLSAAFAGTDPEKLFKGLQSNPQKLVADLIEETFGQLKKEIEEQTRQLEEQFNKFSQGLAAYSQKVLSAGDALDRVSTLRLSAQRASAELQGARQGRSPAGFLSLDALRRPFADRQARLAGTAAGDPEEIGRRLQETIGRQRALQGNLNSPTLGREERARLQESFNATALEANKLQQALHHLADASDESAAIQEKLSDIEKQRSGQLSFTEKLLTSSPKELFQIQRASALSDVAVKQGNFQGFLPNQIREILDYLTSLQDVKLPGYANRTGGEVANNLLNPSNRAIFGRQATGLEQGRDDLLKQQVQVAERSVQAQEVLAKSQQTLATEFLANLKETNAQFFTKLDQLIATARASDLRAAEDRSKAAQSKVQSQVNAIGSIEGLQGIGKGNFGKVRQILNAPEFNAFRAAGIRQAELAKTSQGLFGKGQLAQEARGQVFLGQRFSPVQAHGFDPGIEGRIEGQLQAATSEIIRRTGFTRNQVEQEVIPDVLGKLSDFQAKPEFSRGTFDINQEIVKSIGSVLSKAQQAALDEGNAARNAVTTGVLGSEPARPGEFHQLMAAVAREQPLIAGKIGNGLNEVGDPADLVATLKRLTEATEVLTKQRQGAEERAQFKANGGVAFAPRGTDTVPAMLSPGEFVVNASATRANLSLLQSINSARGPIYRARGGKVDYLTEIDQLFANDSTNAGDLKDLVKQGKDILANTRTPDTQMVRRRKLALDRLESEGAAFGHGDQLNASAKSLYGKLLSADDNAPETTRLSTTYNPLTFIDRAVDRGLKFAGFDAATTTLITAGNPFGARAAQAEDLPEIQERQEQVRRRRLSDPEKQAINIKETPLALGLDPKYAANQISAPFVAANRAMLAPVEAGVAGLQQKVSAAQAESAAFAASPAAAQAATAKGQVDALLKARADRTSQLQADTAQRQAANQAAEQARAAVAARTAASRQQRLNPAAAAAPAAPVANPALEGLPAALANNPKISEDVKLRIVAQENARKGRRVADQAKLADFNKRRAEQQELFNADLLRRGIDTRPVIGGREPEAAKIGKSRARYYDKVASATKDVNKQGSGFTQRQILNAARARAKLTADSRDKNLTPDARERNKNLLLELRASKIGPHIDSLNFARERKGQGAIGATAAQRKRVADAYQENQKALRQKARKDRRQKPFHFADGGMVPAMLTPGEFVVNGASARANGPLLNAINSGRSPIYRQAGGAVGSGGGSGAVSFDAFVKAADSFGEQLRSASDVFGRVGGTFESLANSMTSLSDRLGPFNDAASSLAKALSNVNIPSKIEVATRGDFTVTLNGAAIIAAMKGDMASEVLKQVQAQLEGQVRKAIESMPPRS
jgi:hypothetical protein